MARRRAGPGSVFSGRNRSRAAIVCVVLMLISVNVIAAHAPPLRLDLTQGRLYTISEATRQTLANIDEPIMLRAYLSSRIEEAIPAHRAYSRRVRELLHEYVDVAAGKLRLETEEPLPVPPGADRAAASGLHPVPLGRSGEPGETGYFGLVGTNSVDDLRAIPLLAPQRERLLEYDLTRLIRTLADPRRLNVGLVSGLPRLPEGLLEELRQEFRIEPLPPALEAVPEATDVLMLVQPRRLSEKSLYAIDQLVLRGGAVVVFADPSSRLEAPAGPAQHDPESGLARLFRAWRIRLSPGSLAIDRKPLGLARVDLRGEALNRADPITAGLGRVVLASPGIIEPLDAATASITPLIAMSAGSRHILAARITGSVDTAFPDGPPEKPGPAANQRADAAAPEPLRRSAAPANLVVVADTDLLDLSLWGRTEEAFGWPVVVPVANNVDFVANAIEVLAGGRVMVGLRGRGNPEPPLLWNRAGDRRKATLAFLDTAMVPMLVAVAAIWVAMRRKRRGISPSPHPK